MMSSYSTNKERYGETKIALSFWIDKKLKATIKQQAKRQGMLLGMYIEKILRERFEDKNNEDICSR